MRLVNALALVSTGALVCTCALLIAECLNVGDADAPLAPPAAGEPTQTPA